MMELNRTKKMRLNRNYFMLAIAVCMALFVSFNISKLNAQNSSSVSKDKASVSVSSADKSTKANSKEFKLPEGMKWLTNNDDKEYLNIKAPKGGIFKSYISTFPVTFRLSGPNSNSLFAKYLREFSMRLTSTNAFSLKTIPVLATHWSFAPDKKTVYFKLNKSAKWSDGTMINADDYVYSKEFSTSKHIQSPYDVNYFKETIKDIIKHTDDIISVSTYKKHLGEILIRKVNISPMHRKFHKLDKNWVKDYNWKVEPTPGPYKISSFKHGKFVKFKRIKDWWANDLRYIRGRYNFDEIHLKVIREREAAWQAFLKGDLYVQGMGKPEYWLNKSKNEVFKKGYIKRLEYHTRRPYGSNGIWLNSTDDLWKDKNVRLAFAHALDVKSLTDELLQKDYKRLNAFAGGIDGYENLNIKARKFDIAKVKSYMKASGWEVSEKTGFWTKDSQEIKVQLLNTDTFTKDWLILLAERAKLAGFNLIIDFKDGSVGYKTVMEKKYQATFLTWRHGSLMISFEEFWHSKFAKKNTNNFTMLQNSQLDELIDKYKNSYDKNELMQLSQKILQMIHDLAYFIPMINKPNQRIGYYRFLKLPKTKGSRFGIPYFQGFLTDSWIDQKAYDQYLSYKKAGKSFGEELEIDTTFKEN